MVTSPGAHATFLVVFFGASLRTLGLAAGAPGEGFALVMLDTPFLTGKDFFACFSGRLPILILGDAGVNVDEEDDLLLAC